ncbi:hypothetical protein QVD17_32193 [Tagetes erecta]|uniref:Uncharacterized protein n=1 Tax=Tagetes erecta TaxID=13708 RepID=A0AAD8NPH5_TARER|nr:hypothetical protein QVD17_32193 [Tagetes erecta]
MVPLPGNTRVQTRSNKTRGSGVYHDSFAAQLEIISQKIDSLLSLKNDITAIREAWLARPTQLTKEPEDDLQIPLTNLIQESTSIQIELMGLSGEISMEEQVDRNAMMAGYPETRPLPVDYDDREDQKVSKDGLLDQGHHRLVGEGENEVPEKSMYLFIKTKEQDNVYGVIILLLPKDMVHTNLKHTEINLQPYFILVHRWGYDAGQPKIEWLIAWHHSFQPCRQQSLDHQAQYFFPQRVYEVGQPTLEWLIAWHNNYVLDLRTSRFSGWNVLIRTQLL